MKKTHTIGKTVQTRTGLLIDNAVNAGEFVAESMSERSFQSVVIKIAEANNWKCYHHDTKLPPRIYDANGQLIRTRDMIGKGWVDVVIVRPPRIIFTELKSEKGKMRLEQSLWQVILTALARENENIDYYLWRPRDIDEIEKVLT